ncbi:glycosyltransferase family 4 protein [Enterovirga aerilata]|uniref:Glycosyltransferase family 4 protein n=1 Tax=Enterovirga aerilata TaxID=2730920 RepID=A0A849IJG5_9HYPH|nr:glycosyltransferase family 4 protein [Enterovirga sp. DB1703]NNM74083.1 glycosyltransferase family 4 protein [Enterovirga sp. DB1703]
MRVLSAIVIPPHLTASGAVRAGERLSAELSRQCDITVASMLNGRAAHVGAPGDPAAKRQEVRTGLPPLLPWSRVPQGYRTPFYRSDIPAIVRRGAFDLVHLHNPMPGFELERIAGACRRRRIPYVISTHGYNEIAHGEQIHGFGRAQRLAWRRLVLAPVARATARASGIFALSPADIPIVRGMGYRGEITIVTNGVDLPAPAEDAQSAAVLSRHGIPPRRAGEPLTFMFLANHTPNKGLPILLEAFRRLRCPFRLVIGGEKRAGIDYEGALRACGPGQEILVTGRLDDAELSPLFRRSDCFIFPTLADTLPLAVLEAMAHGLPVIASRVGGIPFEVDDASGILIPPGHPEALARAIGRLVARPSALAEMGRGARRRVEQLFTWPVAAEQALAGYERALAAVPRAHRAPPPRSVSLPRHQDAIG